MSAQSTSRPRRDHAPFGKLLKGWRAERGMSQFALGLEAEVSARHISFVESGRSQPSREMVVRLADALGVPLRDQNLLLEAAGFAPQYFESDLAGPLLGDARRAVDLILAHQEPYPAVVMDRHWNLLRTNGAAERLFTKLLAPVEASAASGDGPPGVPNVVRIVFHPRGLRPWIENWDDVAASLIQRVRREAVGGVLDETARALIEEVTSYEGVPARTRHLDPGVPGPLIPLRFRRGDLALAFFSTVTTLGSPRDVTLQELRIECFFPANGATTAAARLDG